LSLGEQSPPGLHADQGAGVGVGEQAAQPHRRVGAEGEFAGERCGDRSVSLQVGGFVRAAEQRVGVHDQGDLDRHVGRGGLSGETFDQGVGHDLSAASFVPGGDCGVGVPTQGRVGGDALSDGE